MEQSDEASSLVNRANGRDASSVVPAVQQTTGMEHTVCCRGCDNGEEVDLAHPPPPVALVALDSNHLTNSGSSFSGMTSASLPRALSSPAAAAAAHPHEDRVPLLPGNYYLHTTGNTANSPSIQKLHRQRQQLPCAPTPSYSRATYSATHGFFHRHLYDDDYPDYYDSTTTSRTLKHDSQHCALFRCLAKAMLYTLQAESLHRSFCFGAIDGMLTGSGITAAMVGLGCTTTLQLGIVALSLAACTSDGICMAIGHVWSTYVLQKATLQEINNERELFHCHRVDAKSKLAHVFVSRGMLKMDAETIVNALETYPDIFIGIMGGESLRNNDHHQNNVGASSRNRLSREDGYSSHGQYHSSSLYQHQPRSSYGSHMEFEEDRGSSELSRAVNEGWIEGVFMMIAFCLFSILPSLVYISAASVLITPANVEESDYHHRNEDNSRAISAQSCTITILSLLILLLGIWKSNFFDCSWIVFGIETVFVLLVCIFSAYGIGVGLSHCIGKWELHQDHVCHSFHPHHHDG